MEILSFYLRVETSIGTLRLPAVTETLSANTLELGFNWIVFEQPLIIRSIQPFVELVGADSIINSVPLQEVNRLQPDDIMYEMSAMEIGYFPAYIPVDVIPNLADMFLDYWNEGE